MAFALVGVALLLLRALLYDAFAGYERETADWSVLAMVVSCVAGAVLGVGRAIAIGARSFRSAAAWLAIATLVALAPDLVLTLVRAVKDGPAEVLTSRYAFVPLVVMYVGALPLAVSAFIAFRRSRRMCSPESSSSPEVDE
jgi:hypothetical protein